MKFRLHTIHNYNSYNLFLNKFLSKISKQIIFQFMLATMCNQSFAGRRIMPHYMFIYYDLAETTLCLFSFNKGIRHSAVTSVLVRISVKAIWRTPFSNEKRDCGLSSPSTWIIFEEINCDKVQWKKIGIMVSYTPWLGR